MAISDAIKTREFDKYRETSDGGTAVAVTSIIDETATKNADDNDAIRVVITNPKPEDALGPTNINLSNSSVIETSSIGATVGNLTSVGGTGPFVFTITDDPDSKFSINGNDLELGDTLDFDIANEHNVTIRVEDANNKTFDKTFIISVIENINVNNFLVRFNGIDESGTTDNIAEIANGDTAFSLCFTITPRIISRRQSIFSMQSQFSNKRGFEIFIDEQGKLNAGFFEDVQSNLSIIRKTSASLARNEAQFIAITYSGNKTAFDFNIKVDDGFTNLAVENNNLSTGGIGGSGEMRICTRRDGGDASQCDINNIMIFTQVLTAADITTLYNSGNPPEDLSGLPSLLSTNLAHIPITNLDTYPTLTDVRGNYNVTLNANMNQSNILVAL